jgi:hypothetical protein
MIWVLLCAAGVAAAALLLLLNLSNRTSHPKSHPRRHSHPSPCTLASAGRHGDGPRHLFLINPVGGSRAAVQTFETHIRPHLERAALNYEVIRTPPRARAA